MSLLTNLVPEVTSQFLGGVQNSLKVIWDGPAGIVMADGQWAVCILDRNGLRPARYQLDNRNIITIASETGVNPVAEDNVVKKGRV